MTRDLRIARRAIALAGLALLAVHVWSYSQYLTDDALISLSYARRLLAGQGLTWTDGARVEGYSNLLWVLLVAGLGRLGVDLIVAARVLGCLAMGATVVAASRRGQSLWSIGFATFAIALAGPIALWAVGGMETALVAALLSWSIVLLDEKPHVASALLAGLCLTRPDGVLLAATLCVGARQLRPLILPLLACAGQLVFRLVYYGELLPNTASKLTLRHLHDGLVYLEHGAISFLGLILLVALAMTTGWRTLRRPRAMLLLPLVSWTVYVGAVGGDWMPAHRQLVPSLVLLVMLCADGLDGMLARGGDWRIRAPLAGAVALAFFGLTQQLDPFSVDARGDRTVWDCRRAAEELRRVYGARDPLLAVDAAGCLPYWSGMRTLDMLGLNDKVIAHSPVPDPELHAPVGHDLGNPAYVLSRRPDLIVFCGGAGGVGCFATGRAFNADPKFLADYHLRKLGGATLWVRNAFEPAAP
jgi:hypothetical protein